MAVGAAEARRAESACASAALSLPDAFFCAASPSAISKGASASCDAQMYMWSPKLCSKTLFAFRSLCTSLPPSFGSHTFAGQRGKPLSLSQKQSPMVG